MAKEYIEREVAKRELLSWAVCMNHPEYLMRDDAMHVIDSIPAADVVEQEQESKPLNGWISVQDRLPEVGGYVVCIAKRNPFSRFMPMVARIEKNGWVNPITEQYISEVTHWMPMPVPPKCAIMDGDSDAKAD